MNTSPAAAQRVTQLLADWSHGDNAALVELTPLIYDGLRSIAHRHMAGQRADHTLQATALVHEAWLRLVRSDDQRQWHNRAHFFAAAAEAMRRILVDQARRKLAAKRNGVREQPPETTLVAKGRSDEVLAVHDALDALEQHDPAAARLVKLHYFGGFSLEECGELTGVARATAYRQWSYARAWLRTALHAVEKSPLASPK
jgi:RNA polymerase sigma factor (TIGR02999 family)